MTVYGYKNSQKLKVCLFNIVQRDAYSLEFLNFSYDFFFKRVISQKLLKSMVWHFFLKLPFKCSQMPPTDWRN